MRLMLYDLGDVDGFLLFPYSQHWPSWLPLGGAGTCHPEFVANTHSPSHTRASDLPSLALSFRAALAGALGSLGCWVIRKIRLCVRKMIVALLGNSTH